MKLQNSSILEPSVQHPGILSKDRRIAAIPYGNQFMIIKDGQQVHVCRTIKTAQNYIKKIKL